MDISLDISRKYVCILHNYSEGTVSQNRYLNPSFRLIKSKKICLKNSQKLYVFHYKI